MKILVTGGLGFIGSHTVVELHNGGYEVIIIDDLSNSSIEILDGIEKIIGIRPNFVQLDLKVKEEVRKFFKDNSDIAGVIHFAASKAVNESIENPLLYYYNNVNSLVYLLDELKRLNNIKFVFSSSCTVYGQADEMPIKESAPLKKAMSPYGFTKQIGEQIIQDIAKVSSISSIILRYFNPIGAHPSAHIGELPNGVPQNLIPFITQTAAGIREELSVYGVCYPTKDGTAVRDYIHVVDLAKAHVSSLNRLIQRNEENVVEIYNVGTGNGSTVLEVIDAFEKIANMRLNFKIVDKRQGDIAIAYASTEKIQNHLNWSATYSLEDALESAWIWQQKKHT